MLRGSSELNMNAVLAQVAHRVLPVAFARRGKQSPGPPRQRGETFQPLARRQTGNIGAPADSSFEGFPKRGPLALLWISSKIRSSSRVHVSPAFPRPFQRFPASQAGGGPGNCWVCIITSTTRFSSIPGSLFESDRPAADGPVQNDVHDFPHFRSASVSVPALFLPPIFSNTVVGYSK